MAGEQVRAILGSNLRILRSRRNWSQTELAEKAGISMNYLSEIERSLKWPHPDTLQSLAAALNIEVFELFIDGNDVANSAETGSGEYMNRFSNDVALAVERAVKRAVQSVRKQYAAGLY